MFNVYIIIYDGKYVRANLMDGVREYTIILCVNRIYIYIIIICELIFFPTYNT